MKQLKAQVFGMDLMVAIIIFSFAIIFFYVYSLNYQTEAKNNFEFLYYDANVIMDDILSPGSPEDWNSTNVIKIGILSDKKINSTKLENFYNLTFENYNKTRSLFNTHYDYYFFLQENISFSFVNVSGIGKPGFNFSTVNADNLVKISRFTIYKNKPQSVYLYVWEE